jgi:hypothetical protein
MHDRYYVIVILGLTHLIYHNIRNNLFKATILLWLLFVLLNYKNISKPLDISYIVMYNIFVRLRKTQTQYEKSLWRDLL